MELLINLIVSLVLVISAVVFMHFSRWDLGDALLNIVMIVFIGVLITGIYYFIFQIAMSL